MLGVALERALVQRLAQPAPATATTAVSATDAAAAAADPEAGLGAAPQ
jgi:hypothetical protein